MKCQHCDSDLPEGSAVCMACGAPVTSTESPQPSHQKRETSLPNPIMHRDDQSETKTVPVASAVPPVPIRPYEKDIDKVIGLDAETAGIVSLVLGIISLVFACSSAGCGGVFGIFGAILGWLTLRTSGRTLGMWGLILNGLALLGVLAAMIIMVFSIIGGIALGAGNY